MSLSIYNYNRCIICIALQERQHEPEPLQPVLYVQQGKSKFVVPNNITCVITHLLFCLSADVSLDSTPHNYTLRRVVTGLTVRVDVKQHCTH